MFRKLGALAIVVLLTSAGSVSAQGQGGAVFGSGNGSNPDPFNPMASLWGSTGLWKAISAETPPAKSFGTSSFYDRISRNPGQLTINTMGTGVFVGITNRFELGVQVNVNRRILSRRVDQLGLGQATLFVQRFAGCQGCPLLQPPVNMPGQAVPQLRNVRTNQLTGRSGYYPLLPYVNRRLQTGIGEVVVSGKVNLYSEHRGAPMGFAIRPWVSIPTRRDREALLNSGAQLGLPATGIDLLFSKNAGDAAGLHFNAGFAYFPNARKAGETIVATPNMIPLRFGINIPRTTRLQFVGEITAEPFVGGGTPNTSFGPASPVDGTLGFRGYFRNWIALSAGYRHNLNQGGGDKNGFVISLTTSTIPIAPAPPPAIPVPPTLSCSAEPDRVLPGAAVRLIATASTPTGRTLNYAWAAPQGRIEGSGPEVRFDTTGLRPGSYNATVRVNDGAEGFADCTVTVTVLEPPRPNPPTASCSVDRTSVNPGERVTFTVTAGNPDNRPLTYRWTVTGGQLTGANTTRATLDTTNLSQGTYTASARVSDDRGLSADCSASTTVVPLPPRPVMSRLNQCNFKARSARVDNACKAVLDDVALRLQSESDATSVVVGYATEAEQRTRAGARLNADRANNVKEYLVKEKGVADGRISVRATSGQEAQVEVYLVPRGADYTGPGDPVTEPPPPAKPVRKAPAKKK